MSSIDKFYTPSYIAEKLLSYVEGMNDKTYIADFAAGRGELLKAAILKWPKSYLVATDICKSNVRHLRRNGQKWQVSQCDFLNDKSREKLQNDPNLKGKIGLVLLNPPFSCKGGSYKNVQVQGEKIKCSTAFSFLLHSLPFLTDDGQILAILPASCMHNEKDNDARKILEKLGLFEILGTNGHKTFSACTARTTMVRFKNQQTKRINKRQDKTIKVNAPNFNIVKKYTLIIQRGKIQMHMFKPSFSANALPLIHSTELAKSGVDISKYRIDNIRNSISGPLVLLPRVCKPIAYKILIYPSKKPIVLSSCVIAIKCKSIVQAKVVQEALLCNWALLKQAYDGTCAMYITLKKLSRVVRRLGFDSKVI